MIFTDSYINEIVNKAKTRNSTIQSSVAVYKRIGEIKTADELLEKSLKIQAYTDTIENSNILLSNSEKFNIAQKLQAIAETNKVNTLFDYQDGLQVENIAVNNPELVQDLEDLENSLNAHIANSNNPHNNTLTNLLSDITKGNIYASNGTNVVHIPIPDDTRKVLKRNDGAAVGLSWERINYADLPNLAPHSIYYNPSLSQPNSPSFLTINNDSIIGRLDGGAITNISLKKSYLPSISDAFTIPTTKSVSDLLDYRTFPLSGLNRKTTGTLGTTTGPGLSIGGLLYENVLFNGQNNHGVEFRDVSTFKVSGNFIGGEPAVNILSEGQTVIDSKGRMYIGDLTNLDTLVFNETGSTSRARTRFTGGLIINSLANTGKDFIMRGSTLTNLIYAESDNDFVGIGHIPSGTNGLLSVGNTGFFYAPRMLPEDVPTAGDGAIVYILATDATFTSVGFWGYENGSWVKL